MKGRGPEGAGRLPGSWALRPLEAATVLGGETPEASLDPWPSPGLDWRRGLGCPHFTESCRGGGM